MKRYQFLGRRKVRPELFSPGAETVNGKKSKKDEDTWGTRRTHGKGDSLGQEVRSIPGQVGLT